MNVLIKPIIERLKPYGELCYLSTSGSRSYGTYNKESDVDVQGFFIPHIDYIIGIKNVEQVELDFINVRGVQVEGSIYSLQKIIKLFSTCNPNVLEMLWVRPQEIIYKNHIGEKILENREMFLSKRVKHTYGGYAHCQFEKMKLLNKNACSEKRKKRLEEFGYCTKNASHLIRLLTTGYEILTEHVLHVWREDREYLKAIIDGKYTFDQIKEEADRKFQLLEEAYVRSTLPHAVNQKNIDVLLKEILIDKLKSEL